MKEILKKLRKYEIRVRKAINSQMQGDFQSIFKGSGLEFDDVRQYQYGDDVRSIDWNVSAKGQGTFIKTFKEEKEQTVFFILDVSASQEIGKDGSQKIDISKEITSILAMSAIKENSQVGVMCYSDQMERFVKPAKGSRHSYQIINAIYTLEPKSRKTDLDASFRFALNYLKRRSVIFIISDFVDEDYLHSLKGMAKKHDLILIQISDQRETRFPELGIIPLYENESGKNIWVNSGSSHFRKIINETYGKNTESLKEFSHRNDINYLSINTEEDYVSGLIKLFKHRNKSGRRRAK